MYIIYKRYRFCIRICVRNFFCNILYISYISMVWIYVIYGSGVRSCMFECVWIRPKDCIGWVRLTETFITLQGFSYYSTISVSFQTYHTTEKEDEQGEKVRFIYIIHMYMIYIVYIWIQHTEIEKQKEKKTFVFKSQCIWRPFFRSNFPLRKYLELTGPGNDRWGRSKYFPHVYLYLSPCIQMPGTCSRSKEFFSSLENITCRYYRYGTAS